MNKKSYSRCIVFFCCILAFFAYSQKKENNLQNQVKSNVESKYVEDSNDSIILKNNETIRSAWSEHFTLDPNYLVPLPFVFLEYCNWYEEYETGERNDRPYGRGLMFDDNPMLKQLYLEMYNDSIIESHRMFDVNNGPFEIYMFFYDARSRVKLITTSNNKIIDLLPIGNQETPYDWKELTFIVSKELDIIIYHNKFQNRQLIEQKEIGHYKINDEGKFQKKQ